MCRRIVLPAVFSLLYLSSGVQAASEGGWDILNVRLNGAGASVTVAPGDPVRLQYDFQVWNGTDCPGCIRQILAGPVKGPWSQVIGDCAYNGVPFLHPNKTSGSFDYTFSAPTEPGTYQIVAAMDLQYTCAAAKSRFPSQADTKTIATLTVSGELKASHPDPPDGAVDVPLDVALSWEPGWGTILRHDVYFGEGFPPAFVAGQTTSSYDPGWLEPGTTYFWKINEVVPVIEGPPIIIEGEVWDFTTVKAGEPGITIFSDDFESYSVGTFPSTGGWELVWNGMGTNHQVVSNAYSFTGEKSLQLWGRSNWSSVAQRKSITDTPVIGYECAIRIDSIGTGGPGREEAVCFFNREAYIWGRGYAAVLFNHDDGEIKAEDGTVLGDWQPGVWYQVKVVLDRRTNTYDTWIDGQLRAQGLSTTHSDTELIDAIALMSDHAGVKVYYDDVRVFTHAGHYSATAQWNVDFQGDENHNNTYGQTDPVDYAEWGVYWNIFEVAALSAPWPGPTNYATNPFMNLVDSEGNSGLVTFSIIGDAYGWAGGATDDPLTGDYLIILNGFGVTNDPLTWEITGLAPNTHYCLTYYHHEKTVGRGINFVANGVGTTVTVAGSSVASALVTTDFLGRITGTADSNGYDEGNWSALTIATVATTASNPQPPAGATDVDPNAILSWTPGCLAVFNDVYFGTDFDAVANANTSDTTGIYRGRQDANSYTPPETLEPNITYYWRVDGVNNLHAESPWKGDLWSFTGGSDEEEPEKPKWRTGYTGYYTTDEENTVGVPLLKRWNVADSNNQIEVTLKTGKYIWFGFINMEDVDKDMKKYFQLILKGDAVRKLNEPDEVKGFLDTWDKQPVSVRRCGGPRWGKHEGKVTRRFRYTFGEPQPCWVRFRFKANKDISGESITIMAWSICCKVEYWKTGKWPDLPEVKSFGIGDAGADSGVIGVTNIENYAFSIWNGSFLSESPGAVIGVPRITDIYVFPGSSAVNTLVPPNFSADPLTGNWTASFVYTDPNGDSRPQGGVRFASDGPGLGTSDRFNLQVFVAGQIDSTYELYAYDQDSGQYMDFGIDVDIPECNDVVDDFESYTNDSGNRIFETWKDGRGYFIPPMTVNLGNGTGSSVDINSVTVYEGAQSMRFGYDNTGTGTNIVADPITVYYSETERTFDPPQDWTKDDVKALSFWLYAEPNNDVERMYIGIGDRTNEVRRPVERENQDIGWFCVAEWVRCDIDLAKFSDSGIDLTNVRKMFIGVGDRDASEPGGRGTLYFDDIQLCPPR